MGDGMSDKTIIRQRRKHHFVQIPNETARDERLSWKATGLLCYLLSLPDNWNINLQHLASVKRDGRDATRAGLSELEEAGYLKKEVLRNALSQIEGTLWIVSDFPFSENPKTAQPKEENPTLQIPVEQKPNFKNTEYTKTHHPKPGGGGEYKRKPHENLDELVDAAYWQAIEAGTVITNLSGWRVSTRTRLDECVGTDDLDTLKRWRAAQAAAAMREQKAAEQREAEQRARDEADHSKRTGHSQAVIDQMMSIVKPLAAGGGASAPLSS
jgi:hypothetical protein